MRVFGNIPIWGKLGVGFGLVTTILVIQGLVQLTALDSLTTFQEEAAKRAADAREMAAIEQRVISLYIIAAEAIIHDDVGGVKRGLMEFKVQAAKDMGLVRDLVDTDAERRLSEAFVASYGDYLRIVETELFAYREKGGADPTRIHEIDEAIDAVRDASLAPLAKIRDSLIGESDEAAAAFRDESGRAVASLWVLGACGVALALLSGLGISLLIARPLARLAVFAREISQGVIDRDLPIRQADEVGQVAWALRRVTESLRAVLSGFEETAGSLSRGRLLERGDPSRHKGAFARLMTEANGLADLLTRFLDFIPMPLMTMDADLSILFINKAGAGFVKADRAALIGRPRDAVLRTGDRQGQDRASAKAMRTLAEASGETVARLDAGERDIAYSAAPILDQAGRPVGVLEVVTDMTRIKTAQRKMVTLAGEAEDISSRLSRAAEELSVQVGQSSRGAETQRQRAAETATAMEEMNATVMEVAKNAAEAAGFADRTRERAARGADIVARAVTAIGTVQERTSLLRSNMHDLGDKAGAIGSVLTVISDIADQTNLLALNAAIEAARAGDAGRGFAVVADEVRKLAEKTMSATSEVGQAIASIQEAARDNITETDAAAKAVTESAELAEASGQALSEIVTMAEGTADQVRAIATASEQQSAASEEINRATEEINAVSGETMVAMERSDRAVRELAGLVGDLARLIGEMNEGTGEKGPPALEP